MQDVLKDLVKMCDNQESSRQVQALLAAASTQEVRALCPVQQISDSNSVVMLSASPGKYLLVGNQILPGGIS